MAEKEEKERIMTQKVEMLLKANQELMHQLADTNRPTANFNEIEELESKYYALEQENKRLNGIISMIKSSLG